MKKRSPSSRSTDRPSQKKRNRLTKHITLSQKTLALMAAFAKFKVSIDEPDPKESWMIEEGLKLFFEKMKKKFPESKAHLEKVETDFQELNQAPVLSLTKTPNVQKDAGNTNLGEN